VFSLFDLLYAEKWQVTFLRSNRFVNGPSSLLTSFNRIYEYFCITRIRLLSRELRHTISNRLAYGPRGHRCVVRSQKVYKSLCRFRKLLCTQVAILSFSSSGIPQDSPGRSSFSEIWDISIHFLVPYFIFCQIGVKLDRMARCIDLVFTVYLGIVTGKRGFPEQPKAEYSR
jgi:hypothetical protein